MALSAAKQCGRGFLPEIAEPLRLENIPLSGGPVFLASAEGSAISWQPAVKDRVRLFVGPEGGFTPSEEQSLLSAGAFRLKLSPYTLRAETAALAGACMLLSPREVS